MPPQHNEAPPDGPSNAAFQAATQVIESLVKAMHLAALYPPNHKSFREAATLLSGALGELLEEGASLRVDVRDTTLRVQSFDLGFADGQTQRLHELLDPLGLARIEIDRDATAEALHALVTLIQQCRRAADTGATFQTFDSGSLPAGVRAVRRQFGQRVSSEDGIRVAADDAMAAIEETMATLSRGGVDPVLRSTCKDIVDRMFTGLAERMGTQDPETGEGAALSRSLDTVLELGVHAMRKALGDMLSQEEQISNPGDLSAALENAIAMSTDEDSARLMLDVVRQSNRKAEPAPNVTAPPPVPVVFDYDLPLDEFLGAIEALPCDGSKSDDLRPVDRSEQLAILLQLLLQFPSQQTLEGIRVYLSHCLSGDLSADERVILRCALHDLCTHADHSLLDRSLPLIATPLRRSRSEPLPELLIDLVESVFGAREALWPHAANELLLGVTSEAEWRLKAIVESVGDESLPALVARLRQLEAVQKKRFARSVFDPPCIALFPVFAEIMATPQWPVIGDQVLRGLKKDLPTWPGAEVLLRFKKCDDECRSILLLLLREQAIVEASPELQSAAAGMLVKSMRFLSDERRREPWVAQALQSLGEMGYHGATQLLSSVLSERRGVFRRAWPPACRRAARLALRELRAQPRERAA